MTFADAIAADRAGNLESAATLYEEMIGRGDAPLEVLLNCAVLYWQATDPGAATAIRIGPDFFTTAGNRYPELLQEAQDRFPASTEARFWSLYTAWIDLGKSLSISACRDLLREDPSVLVPALYIFSVSSDMEMEAEALFKQFESETTSRARYITSVLQIFGRR